MKYLYEKRRSDAEYGTIVYYCKKDENIKPGQTFGPVIRDIFILECCTEGSGSVIINGKEFSVKAGDAYFLLPGDAVKHTASFDKPREGYFCAFYGSEIAMLIQQSGISSENPYVASEFFDEILDRVKAMYNMNSDNDPGAKYRLLSHLYGILGTILRNGKKTDSNIWIERSRGYIEANYSEDINASAIAMEIGLDRSYFSSLFKRETGITPYTYLTSVRVEKAATLIKNSSYSIGKIAEMVGLDPQNFSRIFKKQTGLSPKEYRRKNKRAY